MEKTLKKSHMQQQEHKQSVKEKTQNQKQEDTQNPTIWL